MRKSNGMVGVAIAGLLVFAIAAFALWRTFKAFGNDAFTKE